MALVGFSDMISIVSALAAIGAVAFSARANSVAKKGNEIAKESNSDAKKSQAIAKESNEIAREALDRSRRQGIETFPRFELISLTNNSDGFLQFSNEPYRDENYLDLNSEPKLLNDIINSKHSISYIAYGDTEYFLINTIGVNDKCDMIRVHLGILEAEFLNYRREAVSLTVISGKSILRNGSSISLDSDGLQVPLHRKDGKQRFVSHMAYAHSIGDNLSVITDKFKKLKESGTEIDFIESKSIAYGAMNFTDSSFVVRVEDGMKDSKEQTLHLRMNDNGRIYLTVEDNTRIA